MLRLFAILCLLGAACTPPGVAPSADANDDGGGSRDAGTLDAGSDAGAFDAGPDASGVDGGTADAGVADGGVTDAGVADAGAFDAGPDAGAADGGAVDAGAVDAGAVDAGAVDAGAAITRVRVHYDTGLSRSIALRGQAPALSWNENASATWTAGNVWTWQSAEVQAPLELKPVLVGSDTSIDWPMGPNWRVQPGADVDIYPFFDATAGRVAIYDVPSSVYGGTRRVEVYLPPSFDEAGAAGRTFPALVMQDGQNLFDEQSAIGGGWSVDDALDELLTTGTSSGQAVAGVREVIVLAPHNGGGARIYEYTPTDADAQPFCDSSMQVCGGGADEYLDFVLTDLLPWARAQLRVNDELPGIAGSSLGGLVSLHACWSRTAAFSRCGVFSPSLWWDDGYMLDQVNDYAGAKKPLRIYLDTGTTESNVADTNALNALLLNDGFLTAVDYRCALGEGHGHNEAAWSERAPSALAALYGDGDRVAASPSWTWEVACTP